MFSPAVASGEHLRNQKWNVTKSLRICCLIDFLSKEVKIVGMYRFLLHALKAKIRII